MGGKLREKAAEVKIYGELYTVNANIEVIDSYSAHADYNELIQFLSCQDPSKVKKVFLVHGEPDAQDEFKAKLQGLGYNEVKTPEMGESFEM